MTGQVTSARFVGRTAEFARLAAVVDAAAEGRPTTLLVAADAGIGASRFLEEAGARLDRLDPPVTVVRCPADATADGRAYGPIVGGLAPLLTALPDSVLPAVVGPNGGEIARLLPSLAGRLEALGLLPERPLVSDLERRQSRLLEGLFGVLSRLAAAAPVVVVLEDLQRVDPATRSLAEFMARVSRGQRIALVASYQPDALTRDHPVHATLAAINGSPRPPERLTLGPLDRDDLADLIEGIEGERPAATVLLLVAERSAGSPIVAEELLAARRELSGASLTGSLDALVTARVAVRSPECRRILRLVASAGHPMPRSRIAAAAEALEAGRMRPPPRSTSAPRHATGPLDADLEAGLAEALDHGFLVERPAPAVVTGDAAWIAVRHELVARALEGDLLPHQRPRHQAALAIASSDHPALAVHHWAAAHRPDAARPAAIAAAAEAETVDAPDQALAFLELALELTGPGEPAGAEPGAGLGDLQARAARAAFAAGRADRAVAFGEAAAAGLDEGDDRLRLALMLARLGRYRWTAGDRDGALDALRRASRLVPAEAARERARVLGAIAQIRMLDGFFSEAIELADEAIESARAAGDDALGDEAHALVTRGVALGWGDDPAAGIALLETARDAARRAGRLDEVFRAYANLSTVLDLQGEREAAVEVAMEGIAAARDVGQDAVYGNFLRGNAADTLFLLGRWDQARALAVASLEWSPAGFGWVNAAINLATIEVEASAGEVAGRLLGRLLVDLETVPDPQYAPPVYQAAASFALWRDDVADARRAARLGWERARGTEDWVLISRLAATFLEVAAADVAAARARRDLAAIAEARESSGRVLAEATEAVRTAGVAAATGSRREADARLLAARAFHARLDDRDDPSVWDAVARAMEAIGDRYQAAKARWRQAEAAMATLDDARAGRAAARGPLVAATTTASELGAMPLLRELVDLAGRAMIRFPTELAADVEARLAALEVSLPVAPQPIGIPIDPMATATVGDRPPERVAAVASVAQALVGEERSRPADPFGLSPREREVLALLAEGRTNRDIGDRLFISQKTVGVHVGNILAKLGVSGRVEAATVAIRLGLTEGRAPSSTARAAAGSDVRR